MLRVKQLGGRSPAARRQAADLACPNYLDLRETAASASTSQRVKLFPV